MTSADTGLAQLARFFDVEGLTARSYDGRAVPHLAKSWTATDDGLTWRFVLRESVKFHDGTQLTAEAARQSLIASLSISGVRALYPGLTDVVDVQAVSDHELTISLQRSSAFLLDDLNLAITRPTKEKTIIGTGAFKTVSETADEIVMEPHLEYHQGRPQIERVVLRPYKTLRTAWASLMREEIDVLADVAHESTEFVGSEAMRFSSFLRYYVNVIAFNSARPHLAQPAVRRALNAAIDRQALIRRGLAGRGVPANGPLWPHHWAYDASVPGYAYDPSLAATTLDAAGLRQPPARQGGVPARLKFVCLVPQNYAVLERLALHVQKQLYDIGVDMQLEALPADEYNRRILRSDFDAVIVDLVSGPVFARPYTFWRWGGEPNGYNVFGYRNARADRWFDALRHAANDAEYRAAAGQLQRVLLEDPPALFLAWNERTRVINRRFQVPLEPGRDPMPLLWQWKPQPGPIARTH